MREDKVGVNSTSEDFFNDTNCILDESDKIRIQKNIKKLREDEIDGYLSKSEVLIGKNVNNMDCRKTIIAYRDKYKKYIPYEIGVMVVISVIVVFIGIFA